MQYRTFSVVVGTMACNARCPFCVARMTPTFGLGNKPTEIDWVAFQKACRLARDGGCETVMLTGNGEPTLFPGQIRAYLESLKGYGFSNVELQTNGIPIAEAKLFGDDELSAWSNLGLKLIAISVAHFDPEKNRQIFLPHRQSYIDLPALIARLRGHGIRVRLTCIMARGFVDSSAELVKMLAFAREHGVDQVTATPVNIPQESRDEIALRWTQKHYLRPEEMEDIRSYLAVHGRILSSMKHGAVVYEVNGQNLCLSNCLTKDEPGALDRRNLIFFPNGTLSTDWQDESAVISA